MSKKIALITGANSQDSSYLIEHLVDRDFEVYGTVRRHSVAEGQSSRLTEFNLEDKIQTFYADLTDKSSIEKVISRIRPDWIINTAAMSHVRVSFEIPEYTLQTNIIGAFNVLESFRKICPKSRFLTLSSSEQFGNSIDNDGYQRESTPMNPVSVYGVSKLATYKLVQHYRRAYNLFASNSICFNHTGPRRSSNFVEQKIVQTAVKISLGLEEKLTLGNVYSYRDFGHAKDYTEAMCKILEYKEPEDFVIATGTTNRILNVVNMVFDKLGLDPTDKNILQYDESQERDEELNMLKGDASKARNMLGWAPSYDFEQIIDEMIDYAKGKFEKKHLPKPVRPASHSPSF